MKKQLLGVTLFSLFLTAPAFAVQPYKKVAGDCKVELKQDTLTIENSLIKRSWLWNNGNLITCKLEDKGNGQAWQLRNSQPDLSLPGEKRRGAMLPSGRRKCLLLCNMYTIYVLRWSIKPEICR